MGSSKNQQVENVERSSYFGRMAKRLFGLCDIQLNGNRPGDIKVQDERLYFRLLKFMIGIDRLALGETYVEGLWDCDDLCIFFEKALQSKYAFKRSALIVSQIVHSFPLLTFNLQTKSRSRKDISHHYDLGNDLFKSMLDRSMNYSCGYWDRNVFLDDQSNDARASNIKFNTVCQTVDEAQMNKMYLIARKLKLEPGMTVLDIGCGWGYLAKFLAINFGVNVVAVTISEEQYKYAKSVDIEEDKLEFLRIPGLKPQSSGTYEFRLQDYRDTTDVFDRIVSVGMLEHVGKKNYDEYFRICHKCLKDDGLVLIQTIAVAHSYLPQVEPWTNRYIFPGGMAPYPQQLIGATWGKFVIEDWHSMGYNYYRTLMAWYDNFQKSWPQLESKYGDRFKRMWDFYLLSSAGLFKSRKLNHWQVVFSKDGYQGGYVSVR